MFSLSNLFPVLSLFFSRLIGDSGPSKRLLYTVRKDFKLICAVESSSGARSIKAKITVGAFDKATDPVDVEYIRVADIDYYSFKGSLIDYPTLKDVDLDEMYTYDIGGNKFYVLSEHSFQRALEK